MLHVFHGMKLYIFIIIQYSWICLNDSIDYGIFFLKKKPLLITSLSLSHKLLCIIVEYKIYYMLHYIKIIKIENTFK